MCVGILGDKARVVGRDAAEPMGSGRGHLQEAVGRMACQYIYPTPKYCRQHPISDSVSNTIMVAWVQD